MRDMRKILYTEMPEFQAKKTKKLYGFIFEQRTMLQGYCGSIAHNLHIPREADDVFGIDDTDIFNIYIFPTEYYMSLEAYYKAKETTDTKMGDMDTVGYEIRKAIHLLAGCNPNMMTYLYLKPEHYLNMSEGGKHLLKHRDLFLGKKRIRDAFCGYAHDQLFRMRNGAYQGYMGEKRKRIVDKYGYDTKNAVACIRLLRSGKELLDSGTLTVYRQEDRDFLLAIKTGKYTLDEIQNIADKEFKQIDDAYYRSPLPETNSKQKINELMVDLMNIELFEVNKSS
jgi:predicted nucleotidyltransferase